MTKKTLQTKVSEVRKLQNVTRIEALKILRETDPKNHDIYWAETNKIFDTKMILPWMV